MAIDRATESTEVPGETSGDGAVAAAPDHGTAGDLDIAVFDGGFVLLGGRYVAVDRDGQPLIFDD